VGEVDRSTGAGSVPVAPQRSAVFSLPASPDPCHRRDWVHTHWNPCCTLTLPVCPPKRQRRYGQSETTSFFSYGHVVPALELVPVASPVPQTVNVPAALVKYEYVAPEPTHPAGSVGALFMNAPAT
jgi:hypothetical protein